MNQETVLQQFAEIEKKIESLIKTCKQLETENADLKLNIQIVTEQLEEKIGAERRHDELKGLIKSRIEGLIGRLDEVTGE